MAERNALNILALNSGSSSIKYRLFDPRGRSLAHGLAERIGQPNSPFPDHRAAINALFSAPLDRINAIGHRVVHGGEQFDGPVLINKTVIQDIKKLAQFAPLHCQPNVVGIEVLQELFPAIPHVAVFDTATHRSMPEKAFLYGLPLEYYEKYKIRRYGFHGINHAYVAHEAARLLHSDINTLKIITCHLGNGCSISAFAQGKSIDNSMGLTPLEGLIMGTRCGDLDPSIVLYLIEERGLKPPQVTDLLNRQSGLLGLCGKSDMRDILAMASQGNRSAQLAIESFVYRIQKCIGAYVAALNGVDAIVFTGGIGENSPEIRARIAENFSYLGAAIDPTANADQQPLFSPPNGRPSLMTIPAQEELMIAQQTLEVCRNKHRLGD